MMKRLRRLIRSLMTRLVISHMLVVILSSAVIGLITLMLAGIYLESAGAEQYRPWGRILYNRWQFGDPRFAPNIPPRPDDEAPDMPILTPGWGIIVDSDGLIVFTEGDAACQVGEHLPDCAPHIVGLPEGERFIQANPTTNTPRLVEVVRYTSSGHTIITHRQPLSLAFLLSWQIPGMPTFIANIISYTLGASILSGLCSTPFALLLVWLMVRPVVRRITQVAHVSQQFAAGDFDARVRDTYSDEVGRLAQQFDSMADTLQQNVYVLRDLAQRNAALTTQAEQLAIQAERARLSRDLHDAIAQRLFSLTVSTTTLPALIAENQQRGVEQARIVASIAEQTLLDLRTLLVELRPASVAERGFAEWVRTYCIQWEATHHLAVDVSLMLSGNFLSSNIESVLYFITQEALSNAARHAHATAVSVSIVEGRQQIVLSITDNGVGFTANVAAATNGQGKYGLLGMRERAVAVGGKLAIESDTSKGCTVRVTLPLQREPYSLAVSPNGEGDAR
jgi:two-component system, NarL family, sensor histidine kinase LiaS